MEDEETYQNSSAMKSMCEETVQTVLSSARESKLDKKIKKEETSCINIT